MRKFIAALALISLVAIPSLTQTPRRAQHLAVTDTSKRRSATKRMLSVGLRRTSSIAVQQHL